MFNKLFPCDDPAFATQTVSYTGTAGTLTGFKPGPTCVLVHCTTDAFVKVGVGVTATTGSMPVLAYQHYMIHVDNPSGALWTVSAIQSSAGGTLTAKPMMG